MITMTDIVARSTPVPFSGCLIWLGGVTDHGYGKVRINKRKVLVHRLAMQLARPKDFSPDLHVLHRCDVRCCVNPDHLFMGTNADNVADKVAKGRHPTLLRAGACKRGHIATPDNIYRRPDGKASCSACLRAAQVRHNAEYNARLSAERARIRASKRAARNADRESMRDNGKTACANGHTLTPENLYIDPHGKSVCRICARAARERYRDRR